MIHEAKLEQGQGVGAPAQPNTPTPAAAGTAQNFMLHVVKEQGPAPMDDKVAALRAQLQDPQVFDDMYAKAPAAKADVDAMAQGIANKYGGSVATAPIKSEARALEKIVNDYDGDASRIKDLARNTIVVDAEHLDDVVADLKEKGANIKEIKAGDDPLGYSGINATFTTDTGITAEIQVNSPEMIFGKVPEEFARVQLGDEVYDKLAAASPVPGGEGHHFYEEWRSMDPKDPQREVIAAESRDYYAQIRDIDISEPRALGGDDKVEALRAQLQDPAVFDEMYAKAPLAKQQVDNMAQAIADEYGGSVATAPIKSEARALEKIVNDYDGDASRIKDLARNTIVVDAEHLDDVVADLKEKGANIKEIKAGDDPLGYSGINATFTTESGITAEIQVNSPEMIFGKVPEEFARVQLGDEVYDKLAAASPVPGGEGHHFYEEWRSMDPKDPQREVIAQQSVDYYAQIRNIDLDAPAAQPAGFELGTLHQQYQDPVDFFTKHLGLAPE